MSSMKTSAINKKDKMKSLIIFFYFIFSSLIVVHAQERKNFNFIITVNKEFVSTCTPTCIYLLKDNGEKTNVDISYYPGNLSIEEEGYEKILSFEGKIGLIYSSYEKVNGKECYNTYDIPLETQIFKCGYVILEIYNLDDKRFKKLYYSFEGKNYIFDLQADASIVKNFTRKEIKKLKRKGLLKIITKNGRKELLLTS